MAGHKELTKERSLNRLIAVTVIQLVLIITLSAAIVIESLALLRIPLILVSGLLGIGILISIIRFNRNLSNITGYAKTITKGELNIDDILQKDARGLVGLAVALNELKYNFLQFIEATKGNVIVLSDAIDNLSTNINQTYEGNVHVSQSVQEAAEKAQAQLVMVNSTLAGIDKISERVESITNSIKGIEDYIENTVEITDTGTSNMNTFYHQLEKMSDNLDSTSTSTENLSKEVEKISEVAEFINNVSEQLKLLGLNAAIEAAKSGEAGKGFSVVASEIRNLSSQTMEGIERINHILQDVNQRNSDVIASIGGFVEQFEEGKPMFESAKESFTTISEQGVVLETNMKGIYDEISEINKLSKEVIHSGEELTEASQTISTTTEEIASISQEELSELEEVNEHTGNLSSMLTGIEKLVRRFNSSVLPEKNKSGKKIRLAFVTLEVDDFWDTIRKGVTYATKELVSENTIVDLYAVKTSEVDDEGAAAYELLEHCIKEKYDGIATMPFFPEMAKLVDEATRKGIKVVVYNADFGVKTTRLATFSPNATEAAKLAADLMYKAIGAGNIYIGHGPAEHSIHGPRTTFFEERLRKYKKINVAVKSEVGDDRERIYNEVKQVLASNKSIDAIYITGAGLEYAAKAIEEMGKAGEVIAIGYDHDIEKFKYVKKGIVYAAIGQDPFGQGHDPLIWLHNTIVTGKPIPHDHMSTRLDVVDIHNVDDLIEL